MNSSAGGINGVGMILGDGDPRVDSWPLMSSLLPTTALCLLYVALVKYVGPSLMRDRPPFNIKYVIIVYNLLQTILSGWMFSEGWFFFVNPGVYSLHCQPVDYSNNPVSIRALVMGYIFFLSKFLDMFDSFFFVARKKFGHLSVLHVFHHASLPFCCWFGPKFAGGGMSGFGPFINSGVHAVMYFYYLLSACGPKVQKFLWWKKYLTSLQMVQFVIVFIHSLQPLFFHCDFPIGISLIMIFNCVTFLFLFLAFYRKAYSKSEDKKES